MDIALDTNILIKDLWLRSQTMRLLFDYIERTDSRFLISEVVIQEADAYFKRQVSQDLLAIDSAIHNAKRHLLIGIPEIDYQQIHETTYTNWQKRFDTLSQKGTGEVYQADSGLLAEAVKRSVQRIPPCKESGEGMRDAVIWLSFLAYCKERLKSYHGYHVAFISENTRDFANSSRNEFLPQLQNDVEKINVTIDYYSSLESFIDVHVKPISHVTMEWVKQRVDLQQVSTIIEHNLTKDRYSSERAPDYFTISDDQEKQLYTPTGTPNVYQIDPTLEGIKLFEFDDAHIEASLEFYVYAEADIDCQFADQINRYSYFESAIDETGHVNKRSLVCITDLRVFISAIIKGDKIEILEIEDISRN